MCFQGMGSVKFYTLVFIEMGLEDAYARELGRDQETNHMWVVLNALRDCFLVGPVV